MPATAARRSAKPPVEASPENVAVIEDADEAGADKQQRDFGLQDHGDDQAGRRDRPLQPVLHAELRKPVTGMEDERDDRRADAVEDGGDRLEVAEIDVERAQRGDDNEVRQDEGPAADPGAPETAAQIDRCKFRPESRAVRAATDRWRWLRASAPWSASRVRRRPRAPSDRRARPDRQIPAGRAEESRRAIRPASAFTRFIVIAFRAGCEMVAAHADRRSHHSGLRLLKASF